MAWKTLTQVGCGTWVRQSSWVAAAGRRRPDWHEKIMEKPWKNSKKKQLSTKSQPKSAKITPAAVWKFFALPSGNQTSQWPIHHLDSFSFPIQVHSSHSSLHEKFVRIPSTPPALFGGNFPLTTQCDPKGHEGDHHVFSGVQGLHHLEDHPTKKLCFFSVTRLSKSPIPGVLPYKTGL